VDAILGRMTEVVGEGLRRGEGRSAGDAVGHRPVPVEAGSTGDRQEGGYMADRADPGAWQRVRQRLRTEIGEDVFSSWFGRAEFEQADKSTVYVSVPTRFLKSWICSHYAERLLALWVEERPSTLQVEVIVRTAVRGKAAPSLPAEDSDEPPPARAAEPAPARQLAPPPAPKTTARQAAPESDGVFTGSPVDPRYGFENFCDGAANRLVFAAAQAVAEGNSLNRFNPLYIHAGVGRGKTHLLQATTRAARRADPGRKVVYLTAENFMFRMGQAIRNGTAIAFKESLRDIDLLLIDDMQFLQGKSIQQEFCHMLNALIDGARQVMVAADRPPADLETLDERVRSRLKGGVAFEIGAPDLDLRRRIIATRYQAAREQNPGLDIPDEVLEYVAQHVASNGRDLEGAINRLAAGWKYTGQLVTLHTAEITLRDLVGASEPRRVRIEDIQRIVARHFNVSKADLLSSRRTRTIVRPRQIAMYLSKTLTPRSLPEIGRRFGGRDHTTVLHAVRKIEELMEGDRAFADEVELLKRQIEE
jgi:chromosomal replication initiator protein